MTIRTAAIINALVSHAQQLGVFERVNGHEPRNAPGLGLSCAIWADHLGPAEGQSGLAATTAYLVFNLRIYSPAVPPTPEGQDMVDPNIIAAVDALFSVLSADLTLGGTVRNIDLLGAQGQPLAAQAGYLTLDNRTFRTMTVTVPLIVNDTWAQGVSPGSQIDVDLTLPFLIGA